MVLGVNVDIFGRHEVFGRCWVAGRGGVFGSRPAETSNQFRDLAGVFGIVPWKAPWVAVQLTDMKSLKCVSPRMNDHDPSIAYILSV